VPQTFHIDSRGLVMEANGMEGTWVATSDYVRLERQNAELRRMLGEKLQQDGERQRPMKRTHPLLCQHPHIDFGRCTHCDAEVSNP
jgi:hypothetical protein